MRIVLALNLQQIMKRKEMLAVLSQTGVNFADWQESLTYARKPTTWLGGVHRDRPPWPKRSASQWGPTHQRTWMYLEIQWVTNTTKKLQEAHLHSSSDIYWSIQNDLAVRHAPVNTGRINKNNDLWSLIYAWESHSGLGGRRRPIVTKTSSKLNLLQQILNTHVFPCTSAEQERRTWASAFATV